MPVLAAIPGPFGGVAASYAVAIAAMGVIALCEGVAANGASIANVACLGSAMAMHGAIAVGGHVLWPKIGIGCSLPALLGGFPLRLSWPGAIQVA